MIVNLYAVYDVCSGIYDGPFPGKTDGVMVRQFSDTVLKPDSPMNAHPGDYTLFKVGTWNDGTGEVVDIVTEKLINGLEAVANNGDN